MLIRESRSRFAHLCLSFLFLVAATNCGTRTQRDSGPVLWHGAAYGMSPDEVRKVVPEVTPPPNKPDRIGDSVEMLRIESFELVNQKFAASFFFKEKKLTDVVLSARPNPTTCLIFFNDLKAALQTKYGPEISQQANQDMVPERTEVSWRSGRVNVLLTLDVIGESYASLNVIYNVRLANEADKL